MKYLTEETHLLNHWFIFGKYPDDTVGISDGIQDIFEYVTFEDAQKLVEARDEFCKKIEELFCTQTIERKPK